jgi:hypothetical protein
LSLSLILEAVATLAAGLFAGASLYINLVEHPARMQGGIHVALTQFRPSYKRASVMQASLAAIGFLVAVAAWLTGAGVWWLVGGVLLGAVIPFTVIVVLPTNKQLLSEQLDSTSPLAGALLTRWGHLHAVRSFLSLAALLIFLALLAYTQ